MTNMLVSILYTDFVMEMVGPL